MFEFYQKLMALRKGQKALQYGTVRFCSAGEVFAMERSCGEDTLVTVVNNTDGEQEFVLPGNRALDLLSGAGYTGEAGKIRLKLPGVFVCYFEKGNSSVNIYFDTKEIQQWKRK